MTYNELPMKIELKRIEVCDILLALTAISTSCDAKKWDKLRDKLHGMLDAFDKENLDKFAELWEA